MTASHLFQDFGSTKKPEPSAPPEASQDEVEDQLLQSFENGYQAGWDDATKAQAETVAHVSSDLATSLQNASFEYHELRSTLNAAMQKILDEVAQKILPVAAHASLGSHIRSELEKLGRDAVDMPIEIAVAPLSETAVRAALGDDIQRPFVLVSDPAIGPSQALIRMGRRETEINLDRVVTEVAAAITTFFQTPNQEVNHG
ncbi:MAG: hypothetical protein AAFR70_08405 [Pseudomonadota bacterium]